MSSSIPISTQYIISYLLFIVFSNCTHSCSVPNGSTAAVFIHIFTSLDHYCHSSRRFTFFLTCFDCSTTGGKIVADISRHYTSQKPFTLPQQLWFWPFVSAVDISFWHHLWPSMRNNRFWVKATITITNYDLWTANLKSLARVVMEIRAKIYLDRPY
jgi:hypothetical protein